jgi:hypothetical protein
MKGVAVVKQEKLEAGKEYIRSPRASGKVVPSTHDMFLPPFISQRPHTTSFSAHSTRRAQYYALSKHANTLSIRGYQEDFCSMTRATGNRAHAITRRRVLGHKERVDRRLSGDERIVDRG